MAAGEALWFVDPTNTRRYTYWYWDGSRSWWTVASEMRLRPSRFDPESMLRVGYVIIPNPFRPSDGTEVAEGL